jgi:chromosome segregation ATPase
MAISKESIWVVADELDAVGDKPTLAVVRKRLGGGSYTTISEAMSEWNARKASRNATKIEPPPERVEEAAKDFAQAVWAAASEIAENRLARERETLEATRGAFEEERQETAAFADSLNTDLEAASKRIDALEREVVSAYRERDTVRDERESERARADRAEATATERLEHIESLKSELAHVRKDRDAEIARLVALLQTQSEAKKN